ncbi:MAG TPA: Mpo1-like protein [Alphaproteobacteria bacterium]|nr:Mpo1-like protein [Alphaproteobacteria bacterium]
MKPLADHMAGYAAYHRDERNKLTHFFGVPTIIFAVLVLMSLARLPVAGMEISLAVAFMGTMMVYYLMLDLALGLAMLAILVPVLWLADLVARMELSTALTVAAATFFGGWALQLLGHKIEGNRPALLDNLFQMLVAPIFLVAELAFALGAKRDLHAEVERRVLTGDYSAKKDARPQAA